MVDFSLKALGNRQLCRPSTAAVTACWIRVCWKKIRRKSLRNPYQIFAPGKAGEIAGKSTELFNGQANAFVHLIDRLLLSKAKDLLQHSLGHCFHYAWRKVHGIRTFRSYSQCIAFGFLHRLFQQYGVHSKVLQHAQSRSHGVNSKGCPAGSFSRNSSICSCAYFWFVLVTLIPSNNNTFKALLVLNRGMLVIRLVGSVAGAITAGCPFAPC